MRVLLVLAHPQPESFAHAVHRRMVSGLTRAGHEVRELDLYGMGFDPVMSEAGAARLPHARGQRGRGWTTSSPICAGPRADLRLPDLVVQPAGDAEGLDRSRLGPVRDLRAAEGSEPIQGRMQNIRLIGAISTYGSPWWWIRLVIGDPGRRMIMRGLRPLCHRRCRTFWLGHYRMDSSTAAKPRRFPGQGRGPGRETLRTISGGNRHVRFRLDGRIALVTGASRGLGFAMAEALAEQGAHVVLNGREPATLAEAAARLTAAGHAAEPMAFDVTDAAATLDAMERSTPPTAGSTSW